MGLVWNSVSEELIFLLFLSAKCQLLLILECFPSHVGSLRQRECNQSIFQICAGADTDVQFESEYCCLSLEVFPHSGVYLVYLSSEGELPPFSVTSVCTMGRSPETHPSQIVYSRQSPDRNTAGEYLNLVHILNSGCSGLSVSSVLRKYHHCQG